MQFWAVGFFNVGFWSANFWAPGGFVGQATQSFQIPQTTQFTVQAGQTLGGPSGGGTPFTVTSN